MGRRKGQINQMGNSLLVKDRFKKYGPNHASGSFLHTTELQDGTNYNRINFQSVTEQNNLEDFLTTAEMAGKDFTAERQNIAIISNPGEGVRLTSDDITKIAQAQNQHKALLQIPRRPPWDEFTSKEELLLLERDSFTTWRRQLIELEEKEHIELTPYEKNLDFWRQLWRVIERSDVVVQIVDARNPLLFRCEDLEVYTREVDSRKSAMLLVNKADYLNHHQRSQWVSYFNKHGIQAVFFSAKSEQAKHQDFILESTHKNDLEVNGSCSEEDREEESESEEENDDIEIKQEKEIEAPESSQQRLNERIPDPSSANPQTSPSNSGPLPPHDQDLTHTLETKRVGFDIDALSLKDPPNQKNPPISNEVSTKSTEKHSDPQASCSENKDDCENTKTSLLLENKADIVTADELLDIFRKLAQPSSSSRDGELRTVGMVGYPNVGKSSTINVILKEKKLAVSATPGRTKHLQTLYVDEKLMLCDCPGLVFPSFVATKAHLVINGILPIDELRDHVSPINLICEYIPRNVLDATYSILISQPSVDDSPDRIPTAEELLNAYGGMRGFMTPRGMPDGPRASRYLLKDFVKGKLLYCNPPPGISGPDFQDKERTLILEAARPLVKAPLPRIQSSVDKDFFQKRQSNINSKGRSGVKGFVRVDCLRPTGTGNEAGGGGDGCSVGGSIAGSSMSINSCGVGEKPWKKHNNRKKKEKLRRLHRDLDVC